MVLHDANIITKSHGNVESVFAGAGEQAGEPAGTSDEPLLKHARKALTKRSSPGATVSVAINGI